MTGERVDPVVPLDPDRLDAIEAQPSLCNECRRPLNTTPGCIGHYPQPMRVLTEADALALVAAAREVVAERVRRHGAEELLSRARSEAEDLRIAIHGCGCPAPYDMCPHDEPFLLIEKRLRVECDALRADAARLAAFHEEQHRSLTSHAAELTVERDALRAEVERLTAEIRRMRND